MVSIVIPTYNEKENIPLLIPRIEEVLKENKIDGEIIVIDDNSPDKTWSVVQELSKKYGNIRLFVRERKQGVGSARRKGFSESKHDIIISMEGDNTHNPDYIPQFVNKIKNGADIVIGSRYLKDSKIINWPLKRRIISRGANMVASFFAGTHVSDVTNGYRAFRKDIWKKLHIDADGFAFNMEFVCEAYFRGYKIEEIPITFKDRKAGKSKLKIGKDFIQFFTTAFRFAYMYRPMKVFGVSGFLISFSGLIVAAYLIYLKASTGIIGNRLPLIILSVVLLVVGLQIFSFGLLVSVISKLRRDTL
ncbi:polyprenol monophosphomannose synthase [Candidatus Woesearchaeota archaeon]|nr:polyprenol monophosphomannose synthase [Candidatus Woesearchaeota archaeon]